MTLLLLHPRVAPSSGVDDQSVGFTDGYIGQNFPQFQVSIAWGNEVSTMGGPTWTDVTQYVRQWGFRRGAEHELARISPGTMTMVLDNRDGRFDPDYAAGPYYPNVTPMKPVRLRLRWANVTYEAFYGLIQDLPVAWPSGGFDSDVAITVIDGFSLLSLLKITTDPAIAITPPGPITSSTIGWASKGSGVDGNKLSVTFIERGPNLHNQELVLRYSATESLVYRADADGVYRTYPPMTIVVALKHAPNALGGGVVTSANDLVAAVKAHPEISQVVDVIANPFEDGDGVLAAMEPVHFSGGTYPEELTGARVHRVLDDAGWPASLRSIDAGNMTIAGASFVAADDEPALAHLLDVDATESGRFFAGKDGKIRFEQRHWRTENRTPIAIVGEQPGEIMPRDLQLRTEIDEIRNDVTIRSAHSVPDYQAQDDVSIAAYARRKIEQSVLTFDSQEAEAFANHILYRYSQPGSRNDEVELLAVRNETSGNGPSVWANVLDAEISDLVTRRRRPRYGGLQESDQRIEAIRMEARKGELKVFWQLSPARDDFWILGDATRGVLGTTTIPGW